MIYVAAPLDKIASARYAANRFRAAGIQVASRWHDTSATIEQETRLTTAQRREIFVSNMRDVDRASAVLMLLPRGGQTAFIEVGRAMAHNKQIHWVYGDGDRTSIADAADLSTVHKSLEAAIAHLKDGAP